MKVVFTREEKLIIERFASARLSDPCFVECNSRDRATCCGYCSSKVSHEGCYSNEIEKYEKSFPKSSILRDFADKYVFAYVEAADLRKKFDTIKSQLEDAENKLKSFEEME